MSLEESLVSGSSVPGIESSTGAFEQNLSSDVFDEYMSAVSLLDVLLVILAIVFLWMLYKCYKQGSTGNKKKKSMIDRVADWFR